jgi:hypothetical protein
LYINIPLISMDLSSSEVGGVVEAAGETIAAVGDDDDCADTDVVVFELS